MRFSGNANIFGGQIVQSGPMPTMRSMRETLPGVRGYRIYQITGPGPDTLTWTVRGRIFAATYAAAIAIVEAGQSYMGTVATFVDNAGLTYRNCELVDYRPATPCKKVLLNSVLCYTVEIAATIQQASR